MSKGTLAALIKSGKDKLADNPVVIAPQPAETVSIGKYRIKPFEVEHDTAQPFGYLILNTHTNERLLYATDTYFMRYTFPEIDYWLVECNYTLELARGSGKPLHDRLVKSHMSLERLEQAIMANDMSKTRLITLIHLSDERSDEKLMVDRIQQVSKVPTVAARGGMEINLGTCPF